MGSENVMRASALTCYGTWLVLMVLHTLTAEWPADNSPGIRTQVLVLGCYFMLCAIYARLRAPSTPSRSSET